MNASRFALVLSLFTAACGSDDSSDGSGGSAGTGGASGGAGGSAGATGGSAGATGGSAGAGASGGQTVSYVGTLTGLLPPEPPGKPDYQPLGPLVGAKVCLHGDATKCATTDSAGKVTVPGIPALSNIGIVVTHADYGRTLLQYTTDGWDEVHAPGLLASAGVGQWESDAGCGSPGAAGTGLLYIGLPAGAAASVTPATKVVYFGSDGVLDPKLTAVAASNTKFGGAVLCDLAPGKYTVDVTGTSGLCSMIEGWPSPGHSLEALVEADTVTYTNWQCN